MTRSRHLRIIVFFICYLLIIPSLATWLIHNDFFEPASAQLLPTNVSQLPIKVSHSRGGETWKLPDGNYIFKAGGDAPTQTWDASISDWVPYKLSTGDSSRGSLSLDSPSLDSLEVQSGMISSIFNSTNTLCPVDHFDANMTKHTTCEITKLMREEAGLFQEVNKTLISRDVIVNQVPVQEDVGGFTVMDTRNDVVVTETYSTPDGIFTIEYLYEEGRPLKHTFTFSATKADDYRLYHEFSFSEDLKMKSRSTNNTETEREIEVEIKEGRVLVKKNNATVLDNVTTTTLEKPTEGDLLRSIIIENASGLPLMIEQISPSVNDTAWDNFVGVFVDATSFPISLEMRYGNYTLSEGEKFVLDPDTFTSNNPTEDGYVTDTYVVSCQSGKLKDTSTLLLMWVASSYGACQRIFIQWDITSIPDSADVTNVEVGFDVGFSVDTQCDFMEMDIEPNTASAATIFTDIGDGDRFVYSDWTCSSAGNNKLVDLGTTADADVEAQLSANWWAVGIKQTLEAQHKTRKLILMGEEHQSATPKPTLTVTYTNVATQPITLTKHAGGSTASWTVSGCNVTPTSHSGTGTTNFTADPLCTLTVSRSNSGTERWVFSDGTASWTFGTCSTSSTTCTGLSKTYYDQHQKALQCSGVDSTSNCSATFDQFGASATNTQAGGSTVTRWVDDTGTLSLAQVITADSNTRFITYGTRSFRVINDTPVSVTFVKEHNPINFQCLGDGSFIPSSQCSETIQLSNSTSITDPDTSTWLISGPATITKSTWNSIDVLPNTDTLDITSTTLTKNYMVNVYKEAYNRFEIGVQNGIISNISYNEPDSELTFTANAPGTKTIGFEHVTTFIDKAPIVITLNGTSTPFMFADSFSSSTSYFSSSTDSFSIINVLARWTVGAGPGLPFTPSGGGGSGAQGSGAQLIEDTISPFAVTIDSNAISLNAGTLKGFQIVFRWEGSSLITVESVTTLLQPEWFEIKTPLPALARASEDGENVAAVDMTVSVPLRSQLGRYQVPFFIHGTIEGVPVQGTEIIDIVVAQRRGEVVDIPLFIIAGVIGAIIIGGTITRIRRKI